MVNITTLWAWTITSISTWWNPAVPELRELGCKRGELYAVMFETTELPAMYVQCKKHLAMAESSLERSKERLDYTLGTGAMAILQKEINDGRIVVKGIKSRCAEYTTQIAEVAATKVQLTDEVAGMQKKPKGQLMADELDRLAEEGGRV